MWKERDQEKEGTCEDVYMCMCVCACACVWMCEDEHACACACVCGCVRPHEWADVRAKLVTSK